MAFQTTIRADIGSGFVGDFAFSGDVNAVPAIITGSMFPEDNVIGRAFTWIVGGAEARAGGDGVFAGILCSRSEYSSNGTTAGGSLAPTNVVPEGSIGVLAERTAGIFVTFTNDFAVGDLVVYDLATGILSAATPGTALPVGTAIVPGAVVVRYNNNVGVLGNIAVIALNGPQPVGELT